MQSGLAHSLGNKLPLQGNAQGQGSGDILVNGTAHAQAHTGQYIMLIVALAIAINMTIIEEGKGIGISIDDGHCIFSAEGKATIAAQEVFLVAAHAVHTAHVELASADHAVSTAPLSVCT